MDSLPDVGEPAPTSDWTASDTHRQLVALGLLAGDWAQTRTIAKDSQNWHEINKILGAHPSVGRVNNYFAAAIAGHSLLATMLPPEYRSLLQYGTIGLEGYMTRKNKMLGIGMTF